MTAIELLDSLRARDIRLRALGGWIEVDAPREALGDDVLAEIRAHKTALIALIAPPTFPCARCGLFRFGRAGYVCFWCRGTRCPECPGGADAEKR